MPSHTLLEASASSVDPPAQELLVLWQHPLSREILPVGRLSFNGTTYGFDYTVAASRIEGFRALSGLGMLGQHTDSALLPAIFRQRVMEPTRPDFAAYVGTLGLSAADATPWEQILESGGGRAGDTLQFMEMPVVRGGYARARFFANGVRHIPGHVAVIAGHTLVTSEENHEHALQSLAPGDIVSVVAEEANKVDSQAALVTASGTPIGWVPRLLAPAFRRLLSSRPVELSVVRRNGPESPSHLRLVLELNAAAPSGFTFDPAGDWNAI
ncbi:hypothetical protein ACH3VR_09180 [Microbacterium sp. B2969]|uniref:HIRAN domain-containing protein n=1 Tax=Microbacterium alkaliflavum TaxID=3248839 RepID=A0ABW7Q6P4_9MICO